MKTALSAVLVLALALFCTCSSQNARGAALPEQVTAEPPPSSAVSPAVVRPVLRHGSHGHPRIRANNAVEHTNNTTGQTTGTPDNTYNWSGYAAETNFASPQTAVTDVKGTWTVPTVSMPGTGKSYCSIWVGIDGYDDSDGTVQQIGIDADVTNGVASYYAWYEMYPDDSINLTKAQFPVKPGDQITAEVYYDSNNYAYVMTMANVTQSKTYTTTQYIYSDLLNWSAEWVVEAPADGYGNILPLDYFGCVKFSGCSATMNDTIGSISNSNWHNVEMILIDQNTLKKVAEPSALSPDGTRFSVTDDRVTYDVVGVASPTAGGTVTLTPSAGPYYYDSVIGITASANPGYAFVNWKAAGSGTISNSTAASTSLTITGSSTATASFTQLPYTVTVTPSPTGTVTVSPTQAIYYYSNTATITATANPGYNFVSWSVTGGTVATKTSSRTMLTVKGNVTLTASYHEIVYSDTLTNVGGTIQFTPSHSPFYLGAVVGVTVTPSAGWQFVSLAATGATLTGSTAPTASLTVLGNFNLKAIFSAITYGVSGAASPTAGGTVSVGSATGTIGQVISISRTANSGYGFTGWTVNDGGHGARLNSGSASITLGSANVTVTGSFALINYPVTVHQATGGAVTLSPSQATYTYSQTGTLTATTSTGYNFVSWSVTGGSVASSTASQTVLTVTGTCSVTASYHEIVYSDTLADVGGGTFRMTPPNGPYYYNTVVGLTASPSAGWQFVSWSFTGAAMFFPPGPTASLAVLGDFDLTATFSAIIYGVSGVASPAAGGTVSVGSATGTIGQVVSLSQTANAGYSFIKWTVSDGGHGAKLNSDSASITFGTSNVTVTASYAQIHYPVVVHQSPGGAVTLSPSQATYTYSQTGTLTATVKPGYSFVDWLVTGGSVVSDTSTTTALTVTGTCSVTASYNQFLYNETVNYVGDGLIILSNNGPYTYGQVITVTALAESGYAFKGWSVTGPSTLSSSTAASTALTVRGDFTLTASYAYVGSLTTLCAFNGSNGANPYGSLTLSGSTLYGMTAWGGANQDGTIFSVPITGGTTTVLYTFRGTSVSANPFGSLTLGGSTLYGLTSGAGAANQGTVFSIPSSGGTPTILYSFSGTSDGSYPNGSLTLSGSTLYGMTSEGGADNYGTIFSLSTSGGTPTILYSFSGDTDGQNPYGSLTFGGSTLYGMTSGAGAGDQGTVFSLPTSGGAPTILYSFSGTTDGSYPEGSLTLSGSTLYGMTVYGGEYGYGTVFAVSTNGGSSRVIGSFDGIHGGYPYGDLTISGSTLYGMTSGGGNMSLGGNGGGTIFSIPIKGGTTTILFSFDGVQGANPYGGLTLSGSTLYGMTEQGGDMNLNGGWGDGTVFSIPITVPHQYTLTVNTPTGGTVTVLPDQATFLPNALVLITGLANTGSNFVSWTVVGGTVASKTASQTLLTVTGNVTLSASFHKTAYSDTLTNVGGKILFTPSRGLFYYDTVVGVTASAGAGWQFVSWSATEAALTDSTATTTSLTVLGNFDLTATYLALTYGVSGAANPTAGGTVSVGSATGTIGQVVSISRTANPGYHFTSWTLNDGGHGAKFNSGSASITLGSSNATVTAGFALTNYPRVTVHQSTGGVVTLSPTQATYTYGQTGTLTATATTSYDFVSWSVTGGLVGSSTASQTVLTVTGTCSVTASFHKIVYSDTLADIGGGKILMTPSNGPYYLGTVVGLTASANTGWKFVSWSTTGGSVLSAGSSKTSLTVQGNFDVTANFSAITYGVSGVASPAAGGTVSVGSATGTIGQVVSISQTANAGYSFIKWTVSDGGHGAKLNSDSASITFGSSGVTVTASYNKIVYSDSLTDVGSGTIRLTPSHGPYTYGQVITATASAQPGYAFAGWSVTGPSTLSNSAAVSTSLTVYGSFTLTAEFVPAPMILCAFTGNSGACAGGTPKGDLTLSGSTLYGMTSAGGADGYGTIFSLPTRNGTPTILYTFSGGSGGASPLGSLTLSGSTLYGMTSRGGANNMGTIFSISTKGGTPTILFSFDFDAHGAYPQGSLTLGGSTLFGLAQSGGGNGQGTIFSIPTSGGTPTVLYSFSGTPDGANPNGSLILSGSTLYGMTTNGGASNDGTIFSISTSGGAPAVLYSFSGAPDGANPWGSLTLSGSTLYGMTTNGGASHFGTVFSLPAGGGAPTILLSFDLNSYGAYPQGSLTVSGSTLYGMTQSGGPQGDGAIFSISTNGGTPNVLYSFSFDVAAVGSIPFGSLTLSGSTLYGMTSDGGNLSLNGGFGYGTVFSFPVASP